MPPIKGRMLGRMGYVASVQQSTKYIRHVQKTTIAKRKVKSSPINSSSLPDHIREDTKLMAMRMPEDIVRILPSVNKYKGGSEVVDLTEDVSSHSTDRSTKSEADSLGSPVYDSVGTIVGVTHRGRGQSKYIMKQTAEERFLGIVFDVAVSPRGDVYVSCCEGLYMCDKQLDRRCKLPNIILPGGVTFLSDGSVAAICRNQDTLNIYSPEGVFLRGWPAGQSPMCVQVNASGELLVSDPTSKCVHIFTATGDKVGTIPTSGTGYSLQWPLYMVSTSVACASPQPQPKVSTAETGNDNSDPSQGAKDTGSKNEDMITTNGESACNGSVDTNTNEHDVGKAVKNEPNDSESKSESTTTSSTSATNGTVETDDCIVIKEEPASDFTFDVKKDTNLAEEDSKDEKGNIKKRSSSGGRLGSRKRGVKEGDNVRSLDADDVIMCDCHAQTVLCFTRRGRRRSNSDARRTDGDAGRTNSGNELETAEGDAYAHARTYRLQTQCGSCVLRPHGFCMNEARDLFVIDTSIETVEVFSAEGDSYVQTLINSDDGARLKPKCIAVRNGILVLGGRLGTVAVYHFMDEVQLKTEQHLERQSSLTSSSTISIDLNSTAKTRQQHRTQNHTPSSGKKRSRSGGSESRDSASSTPAKKNNSSSAKKDDVYDFDHIEIVEDGYVFKRASSESIKKRMPGPMRSKMAAAATAPSDADSERARAARLARRQVQQEDSGFEPASSSVDTPMKSHGSPSSEAAEHEDIAESDVIVLE